MYNFILIFIHPKYFQYFKKFWKLFKSYNDNHSAKDLKFLKKHHKFFFYFPELKFFQIFLHISLTLTSNFSRTASKISHNFFTSSRAMQSEFFSNFLLKTRTHVENIVKMLLKIYSGWSLITKIILFHRIPRSWTCSTS